MVSITSELDRHRFASHCMQHIVSSSLSKFLVHLVPSILRFDTLDAPWKTQQPFSGRSCGIPNNHSLGACLERTV